MYDLILKNGLVINHDSSQRANVVIQDGKIVTVTTDDDLPEARRTIDAEGKWVLPGLVDSHDHLGIYAPGSYEKQLEEETAGALAGGVTTIGQFLIDSPFIESYHDSLHKFMDPISSLSYTDVWLVPVIGSEHHLTEIPELVRQGMTNFKFFTHECLAYSISGSEGDAPIAEGETSAASLFGLRGADHGLLAKGMRLLTEHDSLARIHAEDVEIGYAEAPKYTGIDEPAAWANSKPEFAEEFDTLQCCAIAEHVGSPVFFVHCGHTKADRIINDYRGRGNKVYAEAQIFHLLFNQDGDNSKYGPRGVKTNPPVRTQEHVEEYWQLLKDGFFDLIATDMAPGPKDLKLGQDLWTATTGSNLTEVWLPAMVKLGVQERGVPMERIVELCSYGPARLAGLYPRKGAIVAGADADIVIFDPEKHVKVELEDLHTGLGFNLCEGWEFDGWPTHTILRGTVAVEDGEILVKPGAGEYLPCKPFSERGL